MHHAAVPSGEDQQGHQIDRKLAFAEMGLEGEQIGSLVRFNALQRQRPTLPRPVSADDDTRDKLLLVSFSCELAAIFMIAGVQFMDAPGLPQLGAGVHGSLQQQRVKMLSP
jgi:hypothetical protein